MNTMKSKQPEYVAKYNKEYYNKITRVKNMNKTLNNAIIELANIDNIESIVNGYDNVYSFAQYLIGTTGTKYEKSIKNVVKILKDNESAFFGFKCKLKLLAAVISYKKNNPGVEF